MSTDRKLYKQRTRYRALTHEVGDSPNYNYWETCEQSFDVSLLISSDLWFPPKLKLMLLNSTNHLQDPLKLGFEYTSHTNTHTPSQRFLCQIKDKGLGKGTWLHIPYITILCYTMIRPIYRVRNFSPLLT